jgi:hypothetical protein
VAGFTTVATFWPNSSFVYPEIAIAGEPFGLSLSVCLMDQIAPGFRLVRNYGIGLLLFAWTPIQAGALPTMGLSVN